jgi:hypothetical protein
MSPTLKYYLGSWGEVADIGTSTYVPLAQFSVCSGVSENAGASGYTPYTPTATVTLDTFSTPTLSTSGQTSGATGKQNTNTGSSTAITGSQKSGTTGRRDVGKRQLKCQVTNRKRLENLSRNTITSMVALIVVYSVSLNGMRERRYSYRM